MTPSATREITQAPARGGPPSQDVQDTWFAVGLPLTHARTAELLDPGRPSDCAERRGGQYNVRKPGRFATNAHRGERGQVEQSDKVSKALQDCVRKIVSRRPMRGIRAFRLLTIRSQEGQQARIAGHSPEGDRLWGGGGGDNGVWLRSRRFFHCLCRSVSFLPSLDLPLWRERQARSYQWQCGPQQHKGRYGLEGWNRSSVKGRWPASPEEKSTNESLQCAFSSVAGQEGFENERQYESTRSRSCSSFRFSAL